MQALTLTTSKGSPFLEWLHLYTHHTRQVGTFFFGNFLPTCKFLHAWKPKGHSEPFNNSDAFCQLEQLR